MRILLTGASGLLGGELAGRLLDAGHAVTGLVNRTPTVTRNNDRPVPAAPWTASDPPAPGTCRVLAADLSDPRLGLDAPAYDALAANHDLLIHAAALTRFDAGEPEYRAINVDGTAHALRLARAGAMNLLHVSTAYVCGTRDGPILEDELDRGQQFSNGYERSKAEAERLVRASDPRACIVRPSIVVGDSAGGRIRRFDTFYVVLKLLAEGRVPVLPASPDASLDLVPIDHVADAIAALAARLAPALGRTLHLVADRPTPASAFPATFRRHPGLAAPPLLHPAAFDPAALDPGPRRLLERGFGAYAGYFTRAPRFDAAGARAVLGRPSPPVDQSWWDRLVAYALSAGFIRPRPVRGSTGTFASG